jgi:hypothetical protein
VRASSAPDRALPHADRAGLDRDAVRARQGGWPDLEEIRDPDEVDAELERVPAGYDSVRLRAVGLDHPDDEREGWGGAIRRALRGGLAEARMGRIAYRRNTGPWEEVR